MPQTGSRTGLTVLKAIEKGRFESVYILLVEDTVMADEILRRLKEKLVSPGLEAFDFESYQADELDSEKLNPDVIREHLRQAPAGSPRRMIVITGITRPGKKGPKFPEKLKKEGIERLIEHAAKTPETTTVVLTGIPHRSLPALLRKYGLAKAVVSLKQPEDGELVQLMRRRADERGIILTPDAARELLKISGQHTGVLCSEVDKLASCCEPGERVSAKRVKELAGSTRAYQLQEYVGRVVARDPGAALGVLRQLEEWGEEPMQIIAWLTTGFLNHVGLLAGTLNKADWRVKHTVDAWKDAGELNCCLHQLYRIQKAYLTGRPETWARLETFTSCIRCRRDREFCDLFTGDVQSELCTIPPQRRKTDGATAESTAGGHNG